MASLTLNERAQRLADYLATNAASQRATVATVGGAKVVDCGVKTPGSLQAGVSLARICLAGLADVAITPGDVAGVATPSVTVTTDAPVPACMASQYAGWQISVGKFFAMGSGPIRAAYGKEDLFDAIGHRETPPVAVGTLETRKIPDEAVVESIAKSLNLPASKLTLLVAPAASIAGSIQVVARSLETALHKLHELDFNLGAILSGVGSAPLAPVAADELTAIGRTNDAILYGGRVTIWVDVDDAVIAEIGPKVPSSSSADFGAPFASIFARYQHDFYKIDPMLFSPAEIVFVNIRSGRTFAFGRPRHEVLAKSFFG